MTVRTYIFQYYLLVKQAEVFYRRYQIKCEICVQPVFKSVKNCRKIKEIAALFLSELCLQCKVYIKDLAEV